MHFEYWQRCKHRGLKKDIRLWDFWNLSLARPWVPLFRPVDRALLASSPRGFYSPSGGFGCITEQWFSWKIKIIYYTGGFYYHEDIEVNMWHEMGCVGKNFNHICTLIWSFTSVVSHMEVNMVSLDCGFCLCACCETGNGRMGESCAWCPAEAVDALWVEAERKGVIDIMHKHMDIDNIDSVQ